MLCGLTPAVGGALVLPPHAQRVHALRAHPGQGLHQAHNSREIGVLIRGVIGQDFHHPVSDITQRLIQYRARGLRGELGAGAGPFDVGRVSVDIVPGNRAGNGDGEPEEAFIIGVIWIVVSAVSFPHALEAGVDVYFLLVTIFIHT